MVRLVLVRGLMVRGLMVGFELVRRRLDLGPRPSPHPFPSRHRLATSMPAARDSADTVLQRLSCLLGPRYRVQPPPLTSTPTVVLCAS